MVRCQAHNVYPKPLLSFSELIADDTISTMTINQHQSSPYSQFKQTFPRINVQTIISNESNQNQPQTKQRYTSWFEYRLKIDSIKVGTIFECRLEIPTTNYIRKKRIKLIYPSSKFCFWLRKRERLKRIKKPQILQSKFMTIKKKRFYLNNPGLAWFNFFFWLLLLFIERMRKEKPETKKKFQTQFIIYRQ